MRGKGFTFKQFHIDHSRCAMKVGTDGTLLGAWFSAPYEDCRILDIGTGTGLIAIMAAQRFERATICGIDIDPDCIAQARENVELTKWSERISIEHSSLQEYNPPYGFDHIVSNPPYFVDSLTSPDTRRTTARHNASLPFKELYEAVFKLLTPNGGFSLILPPAEMSQFLSEARGRLFPTRRCEVWSTPESGAKRIMLEVRKTPPTEPPATEILIIEEPAADGKGRTFTEQYRTLTRDFYLKF